MVKSSDDVKRIAILSCSKATKVCSGASCFNAVNKRTGTFHVYDQNPVEVVAFFHCNGCDADYDEDKEYREKIERVAYMEPDAIHIGVCSKTKNRGIFCPVMVRMMNYFRDKGIRIIDGTHPTR